MADARVRTAALIAVQGAALLGMAGCATGSGYSIATTAPFSSDQAFSEDGDEDGGRRRWRRFLIRRGEDGVLVQTADTGGFGGGAGLGRTGGDPAAPVGGLRYLIGNLSPQLGQLGGLTAPVAGMANALTANALGTMGNLPGGAIAQTVVSGGQSTTNLAIASLTTQGAGLGGATSGQTSNGVSVGVGGAGVSAGVATGTGSTPGADLTGGAVNVGVTLPTGGTSLGGVTGGNLAVGLGLGVGLGRGSGGLPSVTTTTTNSGPGILGR